MSTEEQIDNKKIVGREYSLMKDVAALIGIMLFSAMLGAMNIYLCHVNQDLKEENMELEYEVRMIRSGLCNDILRPH